MKTQLMKSAIWILIISSTLGTAWAQEWSFGPKAYLGLAQRRSIGDQVRIGSTLLSSVNYGDAVGGSIGVFARYDRTMWYMQAEATQGKYSLANTNISGTTGSFPTYPSAIRTDIRLIAGVKPLPWLRLSAGLTGVFNRWKQSDYASSIQTYQQYSQQYPADKERYLGFVEQYQTASDLQKSYKKTNIEGQLGIGTDIGGLTLDLTYAHNITPVVNGITTQNQTYSFRQQYGYWALGIGYKLFPLKQHLLAPRKNKAFERLQKDIPFYRNEFHVSVGLLGEDIGSRLIYENRYTRYLTRRVGLTGGLTFSTSFPGNADRSNYTPLTNQYMLLAGVRLLPLYSRRHTIGLTTGPLLMYTNELRAGTSTTQSANGQVIRYLDLNQHAAINQLSMGWHSSFDYHLALTDRLIAGPWLRMIGDSFLVPDYVNFGIQAGYRF
ncbi:hypothetical protein EXU85_34185 [Spirosoma sp. KCTC 42546]|uniref:hypothetical protein n=1 Tax=Spirosoma sp. KCTC 42546 TaxID=2520506 RepID=UPI0011598007|nr:hypothetical protein [Spirosoma sp. KCTC 42546]QDK83385.1 hypothetical protein EXU85_34185 [Spirosoma sp. KCTC 42546]